MKIAVFDAKQYDKTYFDLENKKRHQITYFDENLSKDNLDKAKGFDGVCGFVNTPCDEEIIKGLVTRKVKFWFQRSMGYDRIDLKAAEKHGLKVFRVENYSAETVGEHAASLLLSLNRKIVPAVHRTTSYDFSLSGLEGKQISGSTVGVIGSGKIGRTLIKIMVGMGANVLVSDEFAEKQTPALAQEMNFKWASLSQVIKNSDFISLHAPLLPTTKHLINKAAIAQMKPGVLIVNTSRGGLIDTTALIEGLKSKKIGGVGLDVLERESGRFFFNMTKNKAQLAKEDPEWATLLKMENVIITAHQAFLSDIALGQIAQITLRNIDEAAAGKLDRALKLLPDGKVLNG